MGMPQCRIQYAKQFQYPPHPQILLGNIATMSRQSHLAGLASCVYRQRSSLLAAQKRQCHDIFYRILLLTAGHQAELLAIVNRVL
jgi:hypothetical protein